MTHFRVIFSTKEKRYFVELHLAQIQNHIGYEIPPLTQHIHPLSSTDILFPPYDPWPTPTAGDQPSRGDADTAGYDLSDSF